MKHLTNWLRKRSTIIVIILAAVLLEVISAIQYNYTRNLLEQELEKNSFFGLMASALRIQEITSNVEAIAKNQMWHIKEHLDEPEYMYEMIRNMVKDGGENIIGGGVAFKPNYYPSIGYYFEPYAYQTKDTIVVTQIGSENHDYTKYPAYIAAMKGDTTEWSTPYMDKEGAHSVVTTYTLPILDKSNTPIGFLAIDLKTDWIGEIVNRRHAYPSSFVLVLSPSGQLIASPTDSIASPETVKMVVDMMNDSTVVREEKANRNVTGFSFVDKGGNKGHVYYAPKKREPRWTMVVVCYDKETFGKLEQMRTHIMWLSLLGLAALGFIIQLFVRSHRRLQKAEVIQERIGSELRIARKIQMEMIPRENSVVRKDMQVYGSLVPAREVGGDMFDFFLRDEKLFFCIGDVSGKGIPAALLAAVIHSLFRSASAHENNPSRMMQTINETSCQGNEANMFVTLFIGVLDLPTGRLRYCNAGHDCPFVLNPDPQIIDCKPNIPVGLFEDFKYETQEYMLPSDSILFLYTDGLTEAMNPKHKMFGMERTKKVLQGLKNEQDIHILLQQMTNAVNQYTEDAEQSDDLTMLAIRYTPRTENYTLDMTLTLKNDLSQIDLLGDFVKDVSKQLNLEPKNAGNVRLAVEEAVVNVINYAYTNASEGTIWVEAKSDEEWLKFIISDEGVPFDPTEALQADTTLSAEERPIGGLGIYLVRQLMDSINYERIDNKNILTLRKRIERKS